MGIIDDIFAMDAAAFVDADLFAEVESVTYTPRGEDPIDDLSVQVFREPPQNLGQGPVAGRMLKIFLRRHATAGRLTVDVGGDEVLIAFNKGGTPERKRVAEIESEDAGGFMLILE